MDNYLDPTDGLSLSLSHAFTGGPALRGDFQFMETSFDGNFYFPIDFTETFRTHFKFHAHLAKLWSWGDEEVPFFERYKLGGYNDLRGYSFWSVSPEYQILRSPGGSPKVIAKGGDKQMYYQLEYYVPLIPEAGIKALVFTDAGRVYDDEEEFEFSDFKYDVGFGFRWVTPIAPFRFEWAYPVLDDGSLGDMEIIFNIGY